MDPKSNGKVSVTCLLYIMLDNCLGTIIGAVVCLVMKPGVGVAVDDDIAQSDVMETGDIFADLLRFVIKLFALHAVVYIDRNIVPDNLVAACFQQSQTKYEFKTKNVTSNNETANVTSTVRQLSGKYVGTADSTNILGLIIICSVFGITAAVLKEQGEVFLAFFRSATDIIIKILRVFIWATPVGVASLIARTVAGTTNVGEEFEKLGLYFATVMIGLLVWTSIVLGGIFLAVTRRNPIRFLGTIVPSIMICFATGSTMTALPENFHSLEEKNGVDVRISRFVGPLAATIGRSGSALYIAASCVFIIQTLGRDINAVDVILIILLTWISALAIPAVTGASLVTVLILLTALNIPGEAAAMLFALEFFLDRSRTVVNLTDQLTCAMVADKLCRDSLPLDKPTDDSHVPSKTKDESNDKCMTTFVSKDARL